MTTGQGWNIKQVNVQRSTVKELYPNQERAVHSFLPWKHSLRLGGTQIKSLLYVMKSLQSASAGHSIHGEIRPRELFTEARVSQLSHTAMSRAGLLTYLNVFIFTNFIS